MNNIHGNRVNNDSLIPDGSGYSGDRLPDFMKSGDKWFRGLSLKAAPDGSVYICDWYDARACHQQLPHDRTNGRIYKIVYKDTRQEPVDIGKLSVEDLVKEQLKKNEWLVRHARRVLQERGANPEAAKQLLGMLADNTLDVPQRLRVLWTLHAINGLTPEIAMQQLASHDEHIRAWTIQLLCEDKVPGRDFLERFVTLARNDPSPVVRLYLACALQRLPVDRRASILEGLVGHPEDSLDPNLPMMLWYAAEPCMAADPSIGASLLGSCKIAKILEFVARRMASTPK